MSYGFELLNEDGRTLIDGSNRQVQILKENTIFPRPIGASSASGNSRRGTSSKPTPVMVPGSYERSVIFMHPKKTSSGTEAQIITCGLQEGTLTATWTLTANVSTGQNFALASVSKGGAVPSDVSYPSMDYTTTTAHDNVLGDYLGDVLTGWSGFSGSSVGTITKVETTGTSGVYKLTFSGNATAGMSIGNTATVTKRVVWFFSPNHEASFAYSGSSYLSNYRIEYKMGQITDESEESGTYGMEIYNSSGNLVFSSNRETFQIQNYSSSHTGETDLKPSSSIGSWETGSSGRAITVKKEVGDLEEAWVVVTNTGKSAAFVGSTSGNPYSYVSGTCYVWSNKGYQFYDNKTRAGFADTGVTATLGTNTNVVGVCLTPTEMNYLNSAPQISGGRSASYVNDTWCAEGIRTLLTGKFL